jgi:prokaryotic ubiquitin-like protein Pup
VSTQDSGQTRSSRPTQPQQDDEILEAPAPARGDLDEDVDAILDEIDEVLEENAEDFVKSFVQKGGQ